MLGFADSNGSCGAQKPGTREAYRSQRSVEVWIEEEQLLK